jgi:hypothetical protein
MAIPSVSASIPQLNPLSLGSPGSSPGALSTPPPSGGHGFSMADTFEAAPQRATSGAGYGGTSSASASGNFEQQYQAILQQLDQLKQEVQEIGAGLAGATTPGGAAGPANLGNVTGDPRLQQAMQEIARDPEGAKLAQAAQAQGLKLQVGELPPGVMGQHLDGTITISPRAMSNKPDLIHTLAHELGHAATRPDGDSVNEEQAVDQLGVRIQQRIAPGPTFQLNLGGYQGLPQDNGVRGSLSRIGL